MVMYILLAWLAFVALVYLLMWVDYFTHKHDVAAGIRSVIDTISGEE